MSKECVNGCVRQECKPTFRIPAEWEEQSAVWITWPCMPGWWANAREESLESFARLAAIISRYETVKINCPAKSPKACRGYSGPEDAKRRIEKALGNLSNIEFYDIPTNDVWCRDSANDLALQRNSNFARSTLNTIRGAENFRHGIWTTPSHQKWRSPPARKL
ncbi:MAG: agmatine deiminase family protein [Bacilli bacterium]